MKKTKKILITGASGFVGSTLVERCLLHYPDCEVYAGVRKTSSRTFLQDPKIRFFEMNFSDKEELTNKFRQEQFDFVIHNAGATKADKKEIFHRVNCTFTQNFVEALRTANAIPQKFVFMSSIAAYGPADENENGYLMNEDTPSPITAYGESKLAAENYLTAQDDLPYLIFRPTAVYGPKEKDIYTFFTLLNKRLEPYIGFQKQQLTFVYVKDLCDVLLKAAFSEIVKRAYFVADEGVYTAEDLGRIGKAVLNKKTIKLKVPTGLVRAIATVNERVMGIWGKMPPLNLEKVKELESLNWKCDIRPLKRDFDYQPVYDLEKGLKETLDWYRDNNWL